MKASSIFFRTIVIVFLVEIMVMMFLMIFDISEEPFRSLVDGTSLAILSAPFLYLFVIKPVSRQFTEQIIDLEKKSHSLQLSERRLEEERNLFVTGPVVVFKWENIVERPISYVSANVADVLGYTAEEFTRNRVKYADIIYPLDLLKVVESHNEAVDEGRAFFESEYRVVKKDGSILWVYDVTTLIRNDKGEITNFNAYITDLTKRKEFENLFHSLFDNAIEGIWVIDTDWRTLQINRHMADLLNAAPEDIVEKPIFDFLAVEAEKAMFRQLSEQSPDGFQYELSLAGKNGNVIPCLFNTAPLKDLGGERVGSFAFVTDLTERKKFERILTDSEEKFRKMFSSHSAVMLLIDPSEKGAIIDVNAAAARFYGYTIEALKKMRIYDINTLPENRLKIDMQRAVDGNRNIFLFKHRLSDGTVRDVEVHSSPVELQGNTLLFAIVHDVTERMKFENELRVKKEELESLNTNLEGKVVEEIEKRRNHEQILIQQSKLAAMGEMIGAIAHQWRQPLNALGLIIQDVQDAYDFEELSDTYISDMVRKSMIQINFMSKTIDDFRNFFRKDKEQLEFNVHHVIKDVLSLISSQLENHMIVCSLECDDECQEIKLTGYVNEFKQVILNLVANAKDALVDAVEDGTRSREEYGKICIIMELRDNKLLVAVQDNGPGMTQEVMERMFEPYFTTKEEGKGTGIGLYMSRTIIETNMGGKLTGTNLDGGGACFSIELNL